MFDDVDGKLQRLVMIPRPGRTSNLDCHRILPLGLMCQLVLIEILKGIQLAYTSADWGRKPTIACRTKRT